MLKSLTEAPKSISVTSKGLGKYLGVRKHSFGLVDKDNQIGQVTGLAWTEVGGELLTVEAAIMPERVLFKEPVLWETS